MSEQGLDDPVGREQEAAEPAYTETVVEYVDNNRRKMVFVALVVVLIVLILLLIGSAFAVAYFSRGTGAPAKKDLPKGIEWVRSIYGWGKTVETSLVSPTDVAVGPDGTIWTISAATQIVGFNPDGTLKKLIKPERGFDDGQINTLEGIEVGDDGTIYVTDQGKGSIERFSQNGKWLGHWPAGLPIEVATKGDRLVVTGEGAFGLLRMEGKNAEVLGRWGKRGSGEEELDLPHGVAFGDNGVIFVSDTQNARVKAYKNGKVVWMTAGTPRKYLESKAESDTGPFQIPAGMTVDAAGRVVVVDPFGFNISALNAKNGKLIGQWGDFGELDGYFAYPTGIDYDRARDWFVVADTANNRLQILRIPGSGGTPATQLRQRLVGPYWVCCIPLFLLLALIVAAAIRRRAARRAALEGDATADSAAS